MKIRTSLGEYGYAVVALLSVMSGMNTGCQTLAPATNPSNGPPSSVEQGRTPLDESFD
jgi:hypothetical protein